MSNVSDFIIKNGTLINYKGADNNVVIPDSVTSIGDEAFDGCDSLTSITFPDSVTHIGDNAFSWCSSLTSITIPDSVTSIGDEAFYECSNLANITLPDSVANIGDGAFHGCKKLANADGFVIVRNTLYDCYSKDSDIQISDGVTSIGTAPFWGSSLASITLPDSVTNIGNYAFTNCSSLTNVIIPGKIVRFGETVFKGDTIDFIFQEAVTQDNHAFSLDI